MRFVDSSTLIKGGLLTAIALPTVLGTEVGMSAGVSRRHAHSHQKKHDEHLHPEEPKKVVKRGGACSFPRKGRMVAVAKAKKNGGWALPPDQPCEPGMYCPYACPPGFLMGQWDPSAIAYTYPQSMNGGLLCRMDGEVEVPFPEKDLCYEGAGTLQAKNLLSQPVAICQTVLPGREDMLIPTLVNPNSYATLAVPGPEYWCKTAAHYYINPPGVSVEEGCIWGSTAHPRGNWTPYVAGANIDANGNTFTKIGWNPIYLEPATPFKHERPKFGVKLICEEGKQCNGLPCIIDPVVDDVNSVNGGGSNGASTNGAGGANFCVVTAPPGTKAILVTFPAGKSDDDSAAVPMGEIEITSSEADTEYPTTTSTSSTSTSTSTTSTSTSTSTTSTSTSTSTSSESTSTSCESTSTSTSTSTSSSVYYHNTTTSAYTPTLTPVNQGVANNTVDASLYIEPTSSSVSLPVPSASEPLQGAAAAMIPSVSTLFTLGMAAIAYAVIGF